MRVSICHHGQLANPALLVWKMPHPVGVAEVRSRYGVVARLSFESFIIHLIGVGHGIIEFRIKKRVQFQHGPNDLLLKGSPGQAKLSRPISRIVSRQLLARQIGWNE